MPDYTGPIPVPTPESRPFWEAARRHELVLQHCRSCGTWIFYPRAACPRCLSADLAWERASGRGRLHTFTVVHRGQRDFPLGTPYVIAIVELDEGPRMMTNLVGIAPDPAAIRIGMPVEVVFADVSDTIALPHFRPMGGVSRDPRRLRGRVAIVGAGESDEMGRLPHKSAFALHAEAARNALADAGLRKDDVDAVFSAGLWMGSETAEYLGIRPRWIDGTQIGGCSFIAHVQHAMAAIDAGVVDVALVTHGESGASRIGMPGTRFGADSTRLQYENPFGLAGPPTGYALAAARHMHQYGTTSEQLAEVAVATRKWAQLNPRAMMRDPLTVADVLASRMIAWPLRLLDCCLVTDAGGAVVITSAERARDLPKPPVYVLGTGEASTHVMVSQMPDFATWDAARMSSERAFAMAGVTHADVDVAMFYDAFTIVPIMGLEATGFCKPGEGGAFVAGQRTAPGGAFPMNTNGGGLSYTHTGMYGMFTLVEAVRQLRGECGARQVAGARTAICHGLGGMFSAAATLIAGTEVP